MNKRYFKGWYFKCSTKHQTVAFIPACHRSEGKQTASLQIITDQAAYRISFDGLQYRENPLSIQIGSCMFSQTGIRLDVQRDDLTLQGTLGFGPFLPIRYDIMGPFACVPLMQCRHSVYSMRHRVDGQITLNGNRIDFQNATGYIEGDSGRSFPKRYLWTQCGFDNGSLMLSVADIPLLGSHFTGIIGIVMLDGREHRFATYLGANVKELRGNTVCVTQGKYRFTAKLIRKNAQPLAAPIGGNMARTIYESASCTAYYHLSYKGQTLCEFTSDQASFEWEYKE